MLSTNNIGILILYSNLDLRLQSYKSNIPFETITLIKYRESSSATRIESYIKRQFIPYVGENEPLLNFICLMISSTE